MSDAARSEVALDDRDLGEIVAGSATAKPPTFVGSISTDSVTTWSGTSPIARALPPSHGSGSRSRVTGWLRTECLTHSGTSGSGSPPPAGRPSASALARTAPGRAGAAGRPGSPGAIAPRCQSRCQVAGLIVASTTRVLGRDARGDRLAHHPVDVAVLGDVLRVAVVGAERDAVRAELLHQRAAAPAGCAPSTPRGSEATCRCAAARGLPRRSAPRGPSGCPPPHRR